jgi:hypothetical protein
VTDRYGRRRKKKKWVTLRLILRIIYVEIRNASLYKGIKIFVGITKVMTLR